MIEIKNLNKYYQSGGERVHALKDINIKFPNKGLIFILGPSGHYGYRLKEEQYLTI